MNGTDRGGEIHESPLAGVRIAIDARSLRSPGMGIHSYLSAAIQLLVDEGADVSLLANFEGGSFSKEFPEAHWETFGSGHDIVWDQISLPKFLRSQSFEFYWAPGNSGIPWRSTPGTIRVCTTHDIIPLRLPRMYLLRDPGFAVPYLVWTVSGIFRSDILLTVSQSSALDIARTFHKNPIVISSMISLPNHTVDSQPLPHDLSHSDYLIYTGGMDARKNVHKLLEAFARSLPRHPDLRLVIIGRNTEHLAPLISDLDVASRVILTGFISEEEKSALLEGARALVYPSMYEGFGLPILEAFGADVPVLTCRNSSLFEVAGDAALYVDPDSAASIADGITTILQRDVADKLRTLGRAQLAKYDPLIARQKLVDVFTMRRPI